MYAVTYLLYVYIQYTYIYIYILYTYNKHIIPYDTYYYIMLVESDSSHGAGRRHLGARHLYIRRWRIIENIDLKQDTGRQW